MVALHNMQMYLFHVTVLGWNIFDYSIIGDAEIAMGRKDRHRLYGACNVTQLEKFQY